MIRGNHYFYYLCRFKIYKGMNKTLSIVLSIAAALCIFSCAKVQQSGANDDERRYFNAWLHLNHPDVSPTGLGIYVLEEKEGNGATVSDKGCAFVDYIITDLEGGITNYTDKETAKQMGTYDTTTYYGPATWFTSASEETSILQAGIRDALLGLNGGKPMKVGGSKKFIIPSWLMSYKVFDTPEEYLTHGADGSAAIYEIKVVDFADSIYNWEIEQIGKYLAANQDIYKGMTASDSLKSGFYYKELAAPSVADSLKSDTTIYINYTGKLLNGLVFDTTIEKVAKDNGLKAGTYGPVPVKMASDYSEIKLNGSSVIEGFGMTIKQMGENEKGIGIFWSKLGYKTAGSGASIPGYAPLIFEIELTAKPIN